MFSDYVQPNLQVADKQLDANFFQHKPYLDTFNKDRKTHLVPVALVHVERLARIPKKSRRWMR
ncbi:NLPA lipofamily protein [Bordetella holmesii 35009]|nr:NLPA lipofamily protein [Bordetella holmesii 35009]